MNSQNDWSVEKFFIEKPIQLKLFHHISEFINSLGQVKIKTTKSQISFAGKRQFAWVWLPMEWDKKRTPHSIILSFSLQERINNPQIVQVIESYPGKWMHHVVIQNTSDINELVRKWLTEAYNFGR